MSSTFITPHPGGQSYTPNLPSFPFLSRARQVGGKSQSTPQPKPTINANATIIIHIIQIGMYVSAIFLPPLAV